MAIHLEGLCREGKWAYDFPVSYTAPEQFHIWSIPEGNEALPVSCPDAYLSYHDVC